MTTFHTLLWREYRDHRATLVIMLVVGPLLVAMMQAGFDFSNVSALTAQFLIPGILTIFGGILGGDLICSEAKQGLSLSFGALPVPEKRAYLAKLGLLIGAMVAFWFWLVALEALRIWIVYGDPAEFLGAVNSHTDMAWYVLLIGVASFGIAPLVGGGFSSLLGVLLALVLVPFFFLGPAEAQWFAFLAGPMSPWSVSAWLCVLGLALCIAGYCGWRVRYSGGRGSMFLRRLAAFGLGGTLFFGLAGGVAAGQDRLTSNSFYARYPSGIACTYSPDGKWLAVRMEPMFNMIQASGSLTAWPKDVQERVVAGKRPGRKWPPQIWVFDLERDTRVATIEGFAYPEWIPGQGFRMWRAPAPGSPTEFRDWSTVSQDFAGEPHLGEAPQAARQNTPDPLAWYRPGGGTMDLERFDNGAHNRILLLDADGDIEHTLDELWEPGLLGSLARWAAHSL